MPEEFKDIIGVQSYSAFLHLLKAIEPDARTHNRISKTAVVIDLKRNAEHWEDFYDRALARGLCQHSQEHPELHTSCRFSPALSGRP